MQTFLNIASTEPQGHAYKITVQALYVVNEGDPLQYRPRCPSQSLLSHGKNAEFKVINRVPSRDLGNGWRGVGYQMDWLKKSL